MSWEDSVKSLAEVQVDVLNVVVLLLFLRSLSAEVLVLIKHGQTGVNN